MKKINLAALLVLAGMGWTAQSAHALTYTAGDLLIGFRNTGGSVTQDYVIDLGNVSQFTQMNGATFTLSVGDTLGNLTSIFGATPFTNTKWGVTGELSSTLYAGKNESPFGTFPTSTTTGNYQRNLSATQDSIASNIDTAGGYYATLTAAPNTTVGAIQSIANGSSWASFMSGSAFGQWGLSAFEPTISATTSAGHALDLFRINPDDTATNGTLAPTYVGRFLVDTSTGNITFTAAVPEPSTLTALAGGAALLGLVRRRRAVTA